MGSSVTSAILAVLEEAPPDTALPVQEIVARVTERLAHRDRVPKANEVRGRLTRLRKEGVVEKPQRGEYRLVRTTLQASPRLQELADILEEVVRPEALRRTVLWDATPYLDLAVDGGPGTRLVVEHAQAASLQDEVEVRWRDESALTWSAKPPGPLGLLLWEPDTPAPYRIPTGIVFVERERLGATGLTPQGYRAPFPERVLLEFLGLEGPAEAAPIVRSILQNPDTSLQRLLQAAETQGRVTDLYALLAGSRSRLRPELRDGFLERLPLVVRELVEEGS